MAKIYAPNKAYNGMSATVRFINGQGETDNPKLLKWFKSRGYKVEAEQEQENIPVTPSTGLNDGNVEKSETENAPVDPKEQLLAKYEKMNVDTLKALAKEKNIKGYSAMLRPELIDALLANEGE